MPVDTAIKQLRDSFDAKSNEAAEICIAKCGTENPQVLANCKAMFKVLYDTNVMWNMSVLSSKVGMGRHNQKKGGVDPTRCKELCSDVSSAGFDPDEVRSLISTIEHEDMKECHGFNMSEVDKSKSTLAPVESGSLMFEALWGNHFNQSCRMLAAGMAHGDKALTVDGKLDMLKLKEKDCGYWDAVNNGYTRKIIKGSFLKAWPQLIDILIEAGNASTRIGAAKKDYETMREIHAAYTQFKQPDGSCPFAKVKQAVTRTKLTHPEALPDIFNFILDHSGGASMHLLLDSETNVKLLNKQFRNFGADYYKNLGMTLKGTKQASYSRWAIHLLAHVEHSLVSAADVKKIANKDNLPYVISADDMIRSFATMGKINALSDNQSFREQFALLQVRLAAIMISKKLTIVDMPADFEEAAWMCVNAIELETSIKLTDSYDEHRPEAKDKKAERASTSASARTRMRDISNVTGEFGTPELVLLREAGFEVGDIVVRCKDDAQPKFKILGVGHDVVRLAAVAADGTTGPEQTDEIELFQTSGEYRKAKDNDDVKMLSVAELSYNFPTQHTDWRLQMVKSKILNEMDGKIKLTSKFSSRFEVTHAPSSKKGVAVKDAFKLHELLLVPASLTISARPVDTYKDVVKFPSVDLGVLDGEEGFRFTVSPTFALPSAAIGRKKAKEGFVNPFFLVGMTDNPLDANVEIFKLSPTDMVPCMRNIKALKPGDVLLIKVDKGKKRKADADDTHMLLR